MASLRIAAFACLVAAPALADIPEIEYYAAPNGADQGNCRSAPCKTIQYAADQCAMGTFCAINLAAGTYQGGVDFIEWRRLVLRGNCDAPWEAIVDNNVAGSTTIRAEDHATVIVGCLTLRASAPNVNFLAARQLAIMDYAYLMYTAAPGGSIGTIAAPSDNSSMNCAFDQWFYASATVYMSAGHADVSLTCHHHLSPGINFGYAITVGPGGIVNATDAIWEGQSGGVPYAVDTGTLSIGNNMPPGVQAPINSAGVIK